MRYKVLPLVVVTALGLAACGGPPSGNQASATKQAPPAQSVGVAVADKTTITQTLNYQGNVASRWDVSVVPEQSGRIVQMPVDVGTQVKQGDLIAQLDHATQDLNVENAQAQLQSAQAKLDAMLAGSRAEDVRTAEINVQTAQSKLQTVLNGGKATDVATAQANLNSAQQKLAALKSPRPEDVASAQAALDAAKQKLQTIQNGPTAETIRADQAALSSAQAKLQALKNGPTPDQIRSFQIAVDQAKNSLFAAQATRDAACNKGNATYQDSACHSAQASVDAAQSAVDKAQVDLKSQTNPPTATDLQQAQAAVDQAQAKLDADKKPYTAQDLQQAQDAVTQAEAALAKTKQPGSPQDIAQAQNAVVQAQQALIAARQPYTQQDVQQAQLGVQGAQQALAKTQQPYTAQDIEQAKATVAQAQVAVDQAKKAVADTTVKAPVTGVVTQVNLHQGAMASTAAALVTISSPDVVVQVPVEQTQVGGLSLGQKATITGGALGTQTVPGKITQLAPSGDTKARTFTVEVTPDQQEQLRAGMFVTATIDAQVHKDATVVPTDAVFQRNNQNYVFVVQDNVAKQTPVTLGLSNANLTEITTGIPVGALVVIQGLQGLNDGDRVNVSSTRQAVTG